MIQPHVGTQALQRSEKQVALERAPHVLGLRTHLSDFFRLNTFFHVAADSRSSRSSV